MSYYHLDDAEIAKKLKHLQRLVHEGFITAHHAASLARTYDPELKVCPCCGQWPCDCTIPVPVNMILEAIRRERN